jgi:hypothetical protein
MTMVPYVNVVALEIDVAILALQLGLRWSDPASLAGGAANSGSSAWYSNVSTTSRA